MNSKRLLAATLGFILASSSSWAVITVSGNNLGGAGLLLTSSDGTALPTGSLVRVGFFNDPAGDAAIIAGNDFAAINGLFRPLGEGAAGAGDVTSGTLAIGATAGRFSFQISNVTQTYLPVGSQLYFWALNSAQVGPSSQWAIFTNNDANAGGSPWVAPVDDPVLGGSITLAMRNDRVDDANDIAKGSLFGVAAPTQLRLAVIPEPTSLALIGLVGVAGIFRRRR